MIPEELLAQVREALYSGQNGPMLASRRGSVGGLAARRFEHLFHYTGDLPDNRLGAVRCCTEPRPESGANPVSGGPIVKGFPEYRSHLVLPEALHAGAVLAVSPRGGSSICSIIRVICRTIASAPSGVVPNRDRNLAQTRSLEGPS